jgi:hypothetical protein
MLLFLLQGKAVVAGARGAQRLALLGLLSARSFALNRSSGDDDMTRPKSLRLGDGAMVTADPGPPELAGARFDRRWVGPVAAFTDQPTGQQAAACNVRSYV